MIGGGERWGRDWSLFGCENSCGNNWEEIREWECVAVEAAVETGSASFSGQEGKR